MQPRERLVVELARAGRSGDRHLGLRDRGQDADLVADLAHRREVDAKAAADHLVEVAAHEQLAARVGDRPPRADRVRRALHDRIEHLQGDVAAEVDALLEQVGKLEVGDAGEQLAHPAGAELLAAEAQQRRGDRELREPEQAADLEGRGERQILAAVGHDAPQLVGGVGERQLPP